MSIDTRLSGIWGSVMAETQIVESHASDFLTCSRNHVMKCSGTGWRPCADSYVALANLEI